MRKHLVVAASTRRVKLLWRPHEDRMEIPSRDVQDSRVLADTAVVSLARHAGQASAAASPLGPHGAGFAGSRHRRGCSLRI
jgi:hypothetical protein